MTGDEMERSIEFLINQQARVDAKIEKLTEAVAATQAHLDSVISEMREGFNNLVVANEATRDLANKVASLAIQTGQRMTGLEQRVTDLEQK